jgi:hypothetical protein
MSTVAKTTGRTFIVEHITHAIIVKDQMTVFPTEYHPISLAGEDMENMIKALRQAGFVGQETLINPSRVAVIEEHGANVRVYLEGADRILYMPADIVGQLFPAPESPIVRPAVEKRAKKASI